MKPKSDTTKQPDSKEGLHTQDEQRFTLLLNEGTEDEMVTTLEEYISPFDEDMDDDFINVVNLCIGETYQYGADAIKRISPPVNERKALLDALKACYNCLTMDSDMEEDFAPEIKQVKKLLDKAGW